MDKKIKQSYEKIMISEEAKKRIEMAIREDAQKNVRHKKVIHISRLKVAAAACLALAVLVPTGAYAADKLYHYFTTSVKIQDYHVDMELSKTKGDNAATKQQYIKLVTDFGSNYEGNSGEDVVKGVMHSYEHKDGFYSGKCFWYRLEYLDGDMKQLISQYDTAETEIVTINGRKAVYSRSNTVVDSKYSDEYNTDYGQAMYLFVEDYGYVIEFGAQNGLSKDDLIKLAGCIKIEKVDSEAEASSYEPFSQRQSCAWNNLQGTEDSDKIDPDHYHTKQASYKNATFKIKDVKILDSVKNLKKDAFFDDQFDYSSLVSKDGMLKQYDREVIKIGDGVNTPERKVIKTEKAQPKLVYITMEVKNSKAVGLSGKYYLPSLKFVKEENGEMSLDGYGAYNRPEVINNALLDEMPCYFEESLGGKSGWAAKSSSGTITLHFAYLVDEEFTDHMALWLNDTEGSGSKCTYLAVSK